VDLVFVHGQLAGEPKKPLSPAMIPAPLALRSFRDTLAFEADRRVTERLLIAAEPSIPAILLRNNPAPHEPLHGLLQVSLVAQDRL
jgi:hypothetical protein